MFNRTVSMGNVTRDIELKYLPSGGAVATTGLAMNRKFKKTDGSQGEEVCFIDITFFGRTAEIANQYLKRGSKILVEGRLKLDQWTDQGGQKRSKHSITVESLQMLDNKSAGGDQNGQSGQSEQTHTHSVNGKNIPVTTSRESDYSGHEIPDIDINDDEIPF